METDTGHKGVAGQIPGLFPAQAAQTVPVSPSAPKHVFCTNCGNPVSEQAAACMSCGMKPIGHRKFCRQCGAGLNPEQVVCIKCGATIQDATDRMQTIKTQAQEVTGPIISWLCDFAFQDIRYHRASLRICRFGYIMSWFWLCLFGISASVGLVFTVVGILAVPIVWLFVAYFIYLSRMYYEKKIIELDWKVETTKAARLYVESHKSESGEI
jgi:hypothetical protein